MSVEADFLFSEEARAEMLREIQTLASKHELTPEQLQEVAALVMLSRAEEVDAVFLEENGDFLGEVPLPGWDKPVIALGPLEKDETGTIEYYGGETEEPAERLVMIKDEVKGGLRWCMDKITGPVSYLTGRVVTRDNLMKPLSAVEHALVARRLLNFYLKGLQEVVDTRG